MTQKHTIGVMWVLCWVAAALFMFPAPGSAADPKGLPDVPVQGMVTLLDFGADNCIPCKMLSPIIQELKSEYQGKAAVYFVHVGRHKALAARHGIRMIPTLVFFDAKGEETYRFEGFLISILSKNNWKRWASSRERFISTSFRCIPCEGA